MQINIQGEVGVQQSTRSPFPPPANNGVYSWITFAVQPAIKYRRDRVYRAIRHCDRKCYTSHRRDYSSADSQRADVNIGRQTITRPKSQAEKSWSERK